jgi:nitrate reductase NapE component
MTAENKPEMTPAELEELRLDYERKLIAIQREKRKAKLKSFWQVTKAVLFPLVVVVGVVGFIVYGAMFAVIGESLKKITK